MGVCPDCIKCNVTQFFGKKTFRINLNPLRSILNCIWPNLFRTFGWPSIPELYHLHPPKIKGWECTLIFLLGFSRLSRAVDRYLLLQTQCALSQVTHSQIQSSHVQYTTWDRCVPIQFQDCRFRVVKLQSSQVGAHLYSTNDSRSAAYFVGLSSEISDYFRRFRLHWNPSRFKVWIWGIPRASHQAPLFVYQDPVITVLHPQATRSWESWVRLPGGVVRIADIFPQLN